VNRGRTTVLLMRHATVENPNKVIYGHLPGYRLSAYGRAEAQAAGRALRDRGIKRILHSPLERAKETAEIVNAQLDPPVSLQVEPALIEAEFGRYLQGVPYWQIPIRRPRWIVHRARRGVLKGDESIESMGGRIIAVVHRLAREHPGEVSLCISHADPLQAAWILLDDRPRTEREMNRKQMGRAAILEVDLEGGRVLSTLHLKSPTVATQDHRPA